QQHHLLSPPQLTTTAHHHLLSPPPPPPLDTSRVIQVNSSRSSQPSRKCQPMSHGVTTVTVAGMIVPLHIRRASRLHTRQETRNLRLKAITNKSGPVPIRFEVDDRETLMPLGDRAAHWTNYLGELVRELPLHYPSWRQMPPERKAGVVAKIGTQFDLRPHMESDRWPQIYAGIQHHLQKIYNDWDAQLAFWNDPKNLARAAQNKQNRAKSKVVCRQGSRSIATFRDMHMETSATREYPSLIHTFFLTHTVGGVFLNPEDKALYDEMLRLQGLGSNTPTDGRLFATGNQDKTCRVWDLGNLSNPVSILKGNMGAVRSVRFSSNGQFLVVAEPADFVHAYETNKNYEKRQEIYFFGEISGVSLSPDDETLYVGVWDRTYAILAIGVYDELRHGVSCKTLLRKCIVVIFDGRVFSS
nr:uncharacterized WD repeat-containing protein C2A9.03-like isoform X1 [Tanacetum cinerariifolium]